MKQLLVITDPGKDQDDEVMLILLASMLKSKRVDRAVVIANLLPSLTRARLAKGTLELLGVDIPVGYGKSVVSEDSEQDVSLDRIEYLSSLDTIYNGQDLIIRALEDADKTSISLLVVAGMTDIAECLKAHEETFKEKVRNVVLMSGVDSEFYRSSKQSTSCFLRPDSAANNQIDFPAASFTFSILQKLNIPTRILTRHAAYGCKFQRNFFDEMAATGHPVGRQLKASLKARLKSLWSRVVLPAEHPLRQGLPSRCDKSWFLSTFCDSENKRLSSFDSVWPLIKWINLYDPLALVASDDRLFEEYFDACVPNPQCNLQVVGIDSTLTGVKDPVGLQTFVKATIISQLEESYITIRQKQNGQDNLRS